MQQFFNLKVLGVPIPVILTLVGSGTIAPAAVFAFPSSPTLLAQAGYEVLWTSGDDVQQLQQALADRGFAPGEIDGVYGEQTVEAVRRAQRAFRLKETGVADRALLNRLGLRGPRYPTTTAQSYSYIGTTSYDRRVMQLQQRLSERGFDPGTVDGVYGEQTQAAVARAQLAYELPQTGNPDRKTLEALGLPRSLLSGGQIPQDTYGPGRPRPSELRDERRYVVVVPNPDHLAEVQKLVQSATKKSHRLGDYIAAGEYLDRQQAEEQAHYLRRAGIPEAQVRFF